MHTLYNERTRRLPTCLNNIGVATPVTAIIAPAVSFLCRVGNLSPNRWWFLLAFAGLLVAAGLRGGASFILESLRS